MWDNLARYRIILGSQSPRRVELLRGLDLDFVQRPMPEIDESYPESLPLDEVALYIARQKATAYLPELSADDLLITADTVVLVEGCLLGKPASEEEAREMLSLLSGRRHRVLTGFCLWSRERREEGLCSTEVSFGQLSAADIDYYVSRYRPMDKAGSYGIQEWIGYRAIRSVEGSFYNVMGLPVHQIAERLTLF